MKRDFSSEIDRSEKVKTRYGAIDLGRVIFMDASVESGIAHYTSFFGGRHLVVDDTPTNRTWFYTGLIVLTLLICCVVAAIIVKFLYNIYH